jgi:hypothetical protein
MEDLLCALRFAMLEQTLQFGFFSTRLHGN